MDEEEALPRTRAPQKIDLDPLSIEEMGDYIGELETEIERVRGEIAKKQRHRSDVEGIFRK